MYLRFSFFSIKNCVLTDQQSLHMCRALGFQIERNESSKSLTSERSEDIGVQEYVYQNMYPRLVLFTKLCIFPALTMPFLPFLFFSLLTQHWKGRVWTQKNTWRWRIRYCKVYLNSNKNILSSIIIYSSIFLWGEGRVGYYLVYVLCSFQSLTFDTMHWHLTIFARYTDKGVFPYNAIFQLEPYFVSFY